MCKVLEAGTTGGCLPKDAPFPGKPPRPLYLLQWAASDSLPLQPAQPRAALTRHLLPSPLSQSSFSASLLGPGDSCMQPNTF